MLAEVPLVLAKVGNVWAMDHSARHRAMAAIALMGFV
jgi:hypothetical protein